MLLTFSTSVNRSPCYIWVALEAIKTPWLFVTWTSNKLCSVNTHFDENQSASSFILSAEDCHRLNCSLRHYERLTTISVAWRDSGKSESGSGRTGTREVNVTGVDDSNSRGSIGKREGGGGWRDGWGGGMGGGRVWWRVPVAERNDAEWDRDRKRDFRSLIIQDFVTGL